MSFVYAWRLNKDNHVITFVGMGIKVFKLRLSDLVAKLTLKLSNKSRIELNMTPLRKLKS